MVGLLRFFQEEQFYFGEIFMMVYRDISNNINYDTFRDYMSWGRKNSTSEGNIRWWESNCDSNSTNLGYNGP